MELLERLRREKKLNREFKTGLGKVAYHAACHLRAQKIGFPGARILGLLPDTEVEIVEKCSAVDGTWGMKSQYYEMGRRYARKLASGIENAEAATVVTDCALSAQRILKENEVPALHPAEALARAYGIDPDRDARPGSRPMSRHVERSEVLPLGEYEAVREPFRARVIEEKKRRRVKLGDRVTVLFESHDTVLLQVQEMLRTERISRENAVAHEIETYNALLGGRARSRRHHDDRDRGQRRAGALPRRPPRGSPARCGSTIGELGHRRHHRPGAGPRGPIVGGGVPGLLARRGGDARRSRRSRRTRLSPAEPAGHALGRPSGLPGEGVNLPAAAVASLAGETS